MFRLKHCFGILLLGLLLNQIAVAASADIVSLDKAPINLKNLASLQRGAKTFVNYCQGCHSAQYLRYSNLARDLKILDQDGEINKSLVKKALMLGADKMGATIESSMAAEDAEKWFGALPPDLTLVERVRGADWLYTYLRGLYADESRPWGVNNVAYPMVGMPHSLVQLQGLRRAPGSDDWVVKGQLSEAEFDQVVADLVNFLVYAGEPAKLVRYRIGGWVILFLLVLSLFAYLLKREYWKDIK